MTKARTTAGAAWATWIDESVPDLTDVLRGWKIDPTDFAQWLSERLGTYRATRQFLDELPSRKDEVAWLVKLEKNIVEIESMLKRGSARASPKLAGLAYKRGFDLVAIQAGFSDAIAIVKEAQRSMSAEVGNPGTPHRDQLIAATYTEIQKRDPQKESAVRGLTRSVLEAAGVADLPKTDKRMKDAIARRREPV